MNVHKFSSGAVILRDKLSYNWCFFYIPFQAGRPKAALLLWFFGDFRCGALLFVVIHVIYKYKNR